SGQNSRSRDISRGEKDAIAGIVGKYWNVDLQSAETPRVEVRVRIDASGKLTLAEIVDPALRSDAAARAAVRAVRMSIEQWPVPADGWPDDDFILNFDPSQMR
ncbi:MAG TPA: hypothetical protein VIQ53_02905, partial [Inquilinus sp.]